ncbi:MAG: molybdopterin-guanine dinucleotide biosynthesis protein B [Pseudomonadota bacterium]
MKPVTSDPKLMVPRIVAIVGKSNSGKTTLLERLVACLTRKGYRIGTVKHTHCGFDMDRKGKDSWRHRQAGASATLAVTDDQVVVFKDDTRSPVQKIQDYLLDMDLVLAEGFKTQNFAKIEIFRKDSSHAMPLFMDTSMNVLQNLVAFVTDSEYRPDVPVYGLDDIEAIADFIETRVLNKVDEFE